MDIEYEEQTTTHIVEEYPDRLLQSSMKGLHGSTILSAMVEIVGHTDLKETFIASTYPFLSQYTLLY